MPLPPRLDRLFFSRRKLPMIYRLTIVLVLVALAFAKADGPPRNSATEKKLLGTWTQELTKAGYDVKATVTYHVDGRLSGQGVLTNDKRTVTVVLTGSWKLHAMKLVETVESCEPPLLRRGKEITSEIVEVNDTTLRYVNGFGDEMTKTRVIE